MKKSVRSAFALSLALCVAMPASANDALLKVNNAEAAHGVQTVTIGAFNVGFIFQSMDRGQATGGMIGAFGGRPTPRACWSG